jgi:hypothetical protein
MNPVNRAGLSGICLGAATTSIVFTLIREAGPPAISATAVGICVVTVLTATVLWITARSWP